MLKKYIWFLIDKVLFLESFLAREKAKELLQTVMKISESDRAAYCKQWKFYLLTYSKLSTVKAFCFKKSRNIETFFCNLWDVDIPQIRNKRSWCQLCKLLQIWYAFQWMILICESSVVFIHCIRLPNYITLYNIEIVNT